MFAYALCHHPSVWAWSEACGRKCPLLSSRSFRSKIGDRRPSQVVLVLWRWRVGSDLPVGSSRLADDRLRRPRQEVASEQLLLTHPQRNRNTTHTHTYTLAWLPFAVHVWHTFDSSSPFIPRLRARSRSPEHTRDRFGDEGNERAGSAPPNLLKKSESSVRARSAGREGTRRLLPLKGSTSESKTTSTHTTQ